MNSLQDFIAWVENHQHTANLIIPIIAALVTTFVSNFFLHKKAQIAINREVEKIKHEMQRRYLYIEIKTKNILEIYPKLFHSLREAGTLVVVFHTINNKMKDIPSKNIADQTETIKSLISTYFDETIQTDPFLGLKQLESFSNCYESSSLFISKEIDALVTQSKDLLLELLRLVRSEIANSQYQRYTHEQLMTLLNRAKVIIKKLTDLKSEIARQMNKEFDPFQDVKFNQ